jgi:hypothetical protein
LAPKRWAIVVCYPDKTLCRRIAARPTAVITSSVLYQIVGRRDRVKSTDNVTERAISQMVPSTDNGTQFLE